MTVLNKYAKLLNSQQPKKYTSADYLELDDPERANILQRARANDFKFNNGTVPTFTTSISSVDLLAYSVRSVAVSASTTTAVIDMVAIQNMKR